MILWLLSSVLGVWYLAASIASYVLAMAYNFFLQRAWTFSGGSGSVMSHAFLFAAANLLGLAINTAIVYLFVETMGLWYLAAQAVASVLVAVQSFFAYRWIFARRVEAPHAGGDLN